MTDLIKRSKVIRAFASHIRRYGYEQTHRMITGSERAVQPSAEREARNVSVMEKATKMWDLIRAEQAKEFDI